MDKNNLFKALSSETRAKMLKLLVRKEMHLSGLARELGISVPVASRHIKILEKTGLIEKRKIGNIYLLKAQFNSFENLFEQFAEESKVKIDKNDTLIEALKQIPGIKSKEINGQELITSIDGEEGYYVYEVDGKLPTIPINRYKPRKNVNINLKKIVTINKKKIEVKLDK